MTRGAVTLILLSGVTYFLIGVVFPNPPASDPNQFAWRLAAWVLSFATFAAQIGIEHFRFRCQPRVTGFHTAAGVALGALAIAISANVHAINTAARRRPSMAAAILIWPLVGGAVAFVGAAVVASVLSRLGPKPANQ